MLISTQQELRILIPSHAVDSVEIFQGIIDNSEKDVLKDKLGNPLYTALCEYYDGLNPEEYFQSVTNGTYTDNPWSELLLNAQRIIVNDALARFAYQQVISINGTGVNVVSGNDYGNADDRLLERGVSGYKKEAAIAINNLLILLEEWAKFLVLNNNTRKVIAFNPSDYYEDDMPSSDTPEDSEADDDDVPKSLSDIVHIIDLWKQSKYFYLHADLLIPTAQILQNYLDIYDNRDRFIRLLPDLRFIQDEYIEDAFGSDFLREMLATVPDESSSVNTRLLRKVRRLITAYLEQRTQVLTIDKARRQQAHDEAISLKEQILSTIKQRTEPESPVNTVTIESSHPSYKNNQPNSKIFVSPLLY